ncbi:tetratricopeptide repeat-containing sensor histidine kinase [Aquimarina sp. M1]
MNKKHQLRNDSKPNKENHKHLFTKIITRIGLSNLLPTKREKSKSVKQLGVILSIIIFNFYANNSKSFAQTKIIDSLEQILVANKKQDTFKVNILNDLAFSYHRRNIDKTIEYLKRANFLADSLHFEKGKIDCIYTEGIVQLVKSNLDEAINHYTKALKRYQAVSDKRGIAKCLNGLAIVYIYKGDYETTINYAKRAVDLEEALGNRKKSASSLNVLASAYSNKGDYDLSIKIRHKALEIYREFKDEEGVASCLGNLGGTYGNQANYVKALLLFTEALKINQNIGSNTGIVKSLENIGSIHLLQENYDKALDYYKRVLEINQKDGNKKNIANVYSNIGIIYAEKKEYTEALQFFKKGLEISENINYTNLVASFFINIGTTYTDLEDYPLALKFHKKGLQLNTKIGNLYSTCHSYIGLAKIHYKQKKYTEALFHSLEAEKIAKDLKLKEALRDIKELLAALYYETREYKEAFESHKAFKKLSDSIFNKENIRKITQLEYENKYQKELDSANVKQIKLTKRMGTIDKNLATSQKQTLWAIIGVLVLGILLGARLLILRIRNIQTINQNIMIEQKLLRLQMTPHFIFNSLSVLQGMILNKESKKAIIYLSKFSKLLRIILENFRDKIVPLENEIEAVENYLIVQNLGADVPYEYDINITPTFDTKKILIPPMLIQPFVENAIQHGFKKEHKNRKIAVNITFTGPKLICTIIDNGVGIEHNYNTVLSQKKSLATTITKERLKMMSKNFKVETNITIKDRKYKNEQGTIVTLILPYKKDIRDENNTY